MKSVLLILVCFAFLFGCEEKVEKVVYLGKVQSTRYVQGTFGAASRYVLNIDGSELATRQFFRVNDDVYRVYLKGYSGSSIRNWNPLEVKKDEL